LLFVLCVVVISTLGYMVIEGLSFPDALFTAVSMMTTVGLVIQPMSHSGRYFSILVMVLGIASLLYTFGVAMEYVLEGHLRLALRRRLMENRIAALRDHYIVCGYGRVGSQIAQDLRAAGQPFVVVDEKDTSIELCLAMGYLTVEGDATHDEVLLKAGVPRAKCVLVATENDSTNISITLSARHLSDSVQIVARANHNETEVKLKLAGATRVLSPYTIAGHRMANLALGQGADEALT
jgi:voltage-gated potassium channel